jgi:alpha-beta hydrolase superfamily lysophospholipase
MRNSLLAALVLILWNSPAAAENTGGDALVGHWSGALTRDGRQQAFDIDIALDGAEYSAIFDWKPAGYLRSQALGVKQDGANWRISVPLPRGALRLVGSLHSERLAGTLEEIGNVAGAWKSVRSDGSFELTRETAKPLPYTAKDVTFSNGNVMLSGTILIPKGRGLHPATVFLHGSGDETRGDGMFLADHEARNGIVALVYDKRGTGKSTGDWHTAGFEELGDDAAAGLRLLLKMREVDARRAGFACQSQGCWIAPLAISRGAPAKFLVAMSGPTVTVEDEGFDDYRNRLIEAGRSTDEMSEVLPLLKLDNRVSMGLASWSDLQVEIAKDKDEPWFAAINWEAEAQDDPQRKFDGRTLAYDPRAYIEAMHVPSLWLYGTADITIPVTASVARLRAMSVTPKPTIRMMTDADHAMTVNKDGALPQVVNGYPEAVSSWINAL